MPDEHERRERNAGVGPPCEIVEPVTPAQLDAARALFREYVAAPDWEPEFAGYLAAQAFERELAALPGEYARPAGRLLLATVAGDPAGCVALKALEPPAVCEMKRLWVRPGHRGAGVAGALVGTLLVEARRAGYERMRLDTLPSMRAAQRLYEALGFVEIAPYCDNPVPGAVFLERDLTTIGTDGAALSAR